MHSEQGPRQPNVTIDIIPPVVCEIFSLTVNRPDVAATSSLHRLPSDVSGTLTTYHPQIA